jgi:hypothetical protein
MIGCLRLTLAVAILMALLSIYAATTTTTTATTTTLVETTTTTTQSSTGIPEDDTTISNTNSGAAQNPPTLLEPPQTKQQRWQAPLKQQVSSPSPRMQATSKKFLKMQPATKKYKAMLAKRSSTPFVLCRSSECFTERAQQLQMARAFPDKPGRQWIVQGTNVAFMGNATNAGILYVKNFKAASSTAAGAALRLAVTYVTNGNDTNAKNKESTAWVRFHHTRGYVYANRHPERSLLFTSVRDPAARALSRIFYTHISQLGRSRTDASLLKLLKDADPQFGSVYHYGGGYQVWYTSLTQRLARSWHQQHSEQVLKPDKVHAAVQQIVQSYDFILVAERMDESLVALALVLGVRVQDVLVQSAKQASSEQYYYFKSGKRKFCKRPVKVVRSPAVVAHLQSDEWYAKNYGDYLLHAAAHASLDRTIRRLGRDRFQQALTAYRQLQTLAAQHCANQTVHHCSATGQPQRHLSKQNCYSDDSGCGYPCIDELLAKLKLNETTT